MKKLLKLVGKILLGIVVLVLLAVLTLPLWLGPVVKPSASAGVPKLTKTSFSLGHLSLNPYTGRLEVGGFVLGNPEGYAERTAASLDSLVVDVDMSTLGDEYVHIEEITVNGLFASYVKGGPYGVDNFTQIQYNVAGGKEAFEAKQAKAKQASAAKKPEPKADDASKKKFVIDRLSIGGIRLKLGPMTIPVPVNIVLTDIGKKSNGVTMSELGEQVWQAIMKQAMAVGDGAKLLGTMLGEEAGKLGAGAGKMLKGETYKSAADAGTKAVKDVGESAGKAVDALKGLFK